MPFAKLSSAGREEKKDAKEHKKAAEMSVSDKTDPAFLPLRAFAKKFQIPDKMRFHHPYFFRIRIMHVFLEPTGTFYLLEDPPAFGLSKAMCAL